MNFKAYHQEVDPRSEDVLRKGQRTTQDFWTTFNKLCGNSKGLGALLDIPAEKVAGWPAKINAGLEQIGEPEKSKRSSMVSLRKSKGSK